MQQASGYSQSSSDLQPKLQASGYSQSVGVLIVAYLLNPTTTGDDDIPFHTAMEVTHILHTFFKKQGINNEHGMGQILEFRYREERFRR
jgi:hypothetical protein